MHRLCDWHGLRTFTGFRLQLTSKQSVILFATFRKQPCDDVGYVAWVLKGRLLHLSGAPSLIHPSHWSGSVGKTLRRSGETLFCHLPSVRANNLPALRVIERANTSLLQPWPETNRCQRMSERASRWCGHVSCYLRRAQPPLSYKLQGVGKPCFSPLQKMLTA